MDPDQQWIRTWTKSNQRRTRDIPIDTDWPIDKTPLKVEVETGAYLTPTGEVEALSAIQWQRKRLSDAEWAESQRRCKALEASKKPAIGSATDRGDEG